MAKDAARFDDENRTLARELLPAFVPAPDDSFEREAQRRRIDRLEKKPASRRKKRGFGAGGSKKRSYFGAD